MVIRENIEQYMLDLKKWLKETADERLEEMGAFFTDRLDGYEEHMSVWGRAYERFAELIPSEGRSILDLGCGTGLELDEIFKSHPNIEVTGVDLCQDMLDRLLQKHGDKRLKLVCQDYFEYDMGSECWDTVISFESLHHFLPDKKLMLYRNIYEGLHRGAHFLLGDYIACCDEEEMLLRQVCLEKRKRDGIPEGQFVHFDIPLTLGHETELLHKVGFGTVAAIDCIEGASLVCAVK